VRDLIRNCSEKAIIIFSAEVLSGKAPIDLVLLLFYEPSISEEV
jgi:hypothetical protein